MARTRWSLPLGRPRRLGAGLLGICTLAAASLPLAAPARADDPVQTCRSSIVTAGEIQTSALVVSRDLDAHSTAEGWESCTVG